MFQMVKGKVEVAEEVVEVGQVVVGLVIALEMGLVIEVVVEVGQ